MGAAHGDAEARAGTGDDLPDGIGPDAEVGTDLGVRVPLDLAQHERTPLTAGQHRGAPAHEAPLLDQQDRPLGIDLEIVIRPDRALDVAIGDLVMVAELLPEDVARGGVEVAGDVHVRGRLGEARHEAREDLLREVLGGVHVAGQSPTAPQQAGRVELVQLLERASSRQRFRELPCLLYRRHTGPPLLKRLTNEYESHRAREP